MAQILLAKEILLSNVIYFQNKTFFRQLSFQLVLLLKYLLFEFFKFLFEKIFFLNTAANDCTVSEAKLNTQNQM